MRDWINSSLSCGDANVYCKTCEEKCVFNKNNKLYECECRFGASAAALTVGLEGYKVEY